MKPIAFEADSLQNLRSFPQSARREAGYQIDRLRSGVQSDDCKPMVSISAGAYEIRVQDSAGVFRMIYVAKRPDAIYVLHAFQKKAQQTIEQDMELARKRYRILTRQR